MDPTALTLEDVSIHAWIQQHQLKTERGEPLEFFDHPFLYDIYSDMSPLQCVMKPAQVGMSTVQNFKPFWIAKTRKLDIVYTLPTADDVIDFVNGKTNRLIQQNPVLQTLTQDGNTIEQKRVGDSVIYFRGTWVKKAAMMVPADLLIHDEIDASKQDIVESYESRLQHSKYKWRWIFSHPSTEGVGVHKYWLLSDQKKWFVTCEHCKKEQVLEWPRSICPRRREYVCVFCDKVMSDTVRRLGRWKATQVGTGWSGYWISALMCPWQSADAILRLHDTKDGEFFTTKVLGLPYVGEGNKLVYEDIRKNIQEPIELGPERQVVVGVDTGIKLHYVLGTSLGFHEYGELSGYAELEDILKRFPKAIFVFDQGGDLIGPRDFMEKHRGRVYLCHYEKDKKTMELIRWGEDAEEGNVKVDRNRMITLIVGEFRDKRLPLYGTEEYWHGFWLHAANIYRARVPNEILQTYEYRWLRGGPDHWLHALLYARVGLSRFDGAHGTSVGSLGAAREDEFQKGLYIMPDGRYSYNPLEGLE